ncbi:hypothetical protein [Luteococcus sp.]|uniref:hypothetical protein n=1 Tax=Luteococcus sp. TaxID=1969402 RepID=UPI00373702E0
MGAVQVQQDGGGVVHDPQVSAVRCDIAGLESIRIVGNIVQVEIDQDAAFFYLAVLGEVEPLRPVSIRRRT